MKASKFLEAATLGCAVAMVAAMSAEALGDGPKDTGIGVYVSQKPEGLVIKRVVEFSGAWLAGFEKGDVIVGVDGKDIKGNRKSRGLIGTPCTRVEVTVQRGGKKITENVLRIPAHNALGLDCLGYMQFRTETHRKLVKVGRLMYREWKKGPVSKRQDVLKKAYGLKVVSGTEYASSLDELDRYIDAFAEEYEEVPKEDLKVLREHVDELLVKLTELLPEGKADGTWIIERIHVRFSEANQKDKPTRGHVDNRAFTVITPIKGATTRFHPLGCYAKGEQYDDYSQFKGARSDASMVMAGFQRFDKWGLPKDTRSRYSKNAAKMPPALEKMAERCRWKGQNDPGKRFMGVRHEKPKSTANRLVLLVDLSFRPK